MAKMKDENWKTSWSAGLSWENTRLTFGQLFEVERFICFKRSAG